MMSILLEIVRLKQKYIVLVSVLVLINVGISTYIDSSVSPDINKLQLKWSELRRKVAVTGRADVNSLYKKGKTDLAKIAERIPSKRQFPSVLGDIMETASSNNVDSGNISYKPEMVKDQNLLAYSVTMNVNGSYAGIKNFLADMQLANDLVVIDNLAITQTDPLTENVSMTLHLTVYLREGA